MKKKTLGHSLGKKAVFSEGVTCFVDLFTRQINEILAAILPNDGFRSCT